MRLVLVAAVALALAAPAAASPRLSPADRAAITRSIDVFVNHAVKRIDTAAAYDVVAPEMRPGISRKQWTRGDIPAYPFPARGTTHPWNILYVTRDEVGLELQLNPREGSSGHGDDPDLGLERGHGDADEEDRDQGEERAQRAALRRSPHRRRV
jgi:hypothetical protein